MTTPTRNGKIARLPSALREEINQRLNEGATAKSLVAWLNGLPAVQSLVQTEFGGHPIREQNLSQWKRGGHQDWLRQQEAMALARHLYEGADEMQAEAKGRPPMSEVLTVWTTSRYAVATRQIDRAKGPEKWRMLRQMCSDVVKLRRMEMDAERLQMDRERLQLDRGKRQKTAHQTATNSPSAGGAEREEITPRSEPKPNHPQQTHREEKKPAAVSKPEILGFIHPLLTEEQKVARWKDVLGIAA